MLQCPPSCLATIVTCLFIFLPPPARPPAPALLRLADCQMHQEMAVDTSPNRWATFIRQMIPHHLNAVGMAKLILKQSTFEEDGEGDSEGYEELKHMGAPPPLAMSHSPVWPE